MNEPTQPGLGPQTGETLESVVSGETAAHASSATGDAARSASGFPLDSMFNSTEEMLQGLRPGLVIAERFRLEAPLGQGGMGVVHRCRDLELDRKARTGLCHRRRW